MWAAANHHETVQTEITKNIKASCLIWALRADQQYYSLSRCLSFPFLKIPKFWPSYIPNLSLPPSFLACGLVFYFCWENGVHQARTVYIFFPITFKYIRIFTHPPLCHGKETLFLPQVIYSMCALGLIFIHCLKDLGLACIFNLSLSTEPFTSSYKHELFSHIYVKIYWHCI